MSPPRSWKTAKRPSPSFTPASTGPSPISTAFPKDQLEGAENRTIQLNFGDFKPSFTGTSYLLTFALPNFFFHVTTAYDILRHKGVKIGKRDYLRLKG